ncbi:hypothetical protein GH714_019727 [Hevea brasiliensis]|uniref:Uncharacterized protein n=1 Tax=Hevea brasiliensis TaxID=3981 RepID=A0A6A6L716_HEVBR|nr:hypothetical protein GH714_019727 [Hevea brasiliensis]
MNEEGWFNKYSGHEVSFDFCFKGLPELIHMLHCNIKKCGVRLLYVEAKTKSSRMFDSDNEEEESNSKRIKYSDDQESLHLPVFAIQKLESKSNEDYEFEHEQVCGYIRQFVDDNSYNHISNERVSLTNSATNGVVSFEMAKESVLNKEMRRRSQGFSSQTKVLVTENGGRSKQKAQKGRDKSWSKSRSQIRMLSVIIVARQVILRMGNGGLSQVVGIGDVCLDTGNGMKLMLKEVRHAPDVRLNLISARRLDDKGYLNIMGENHVLLWYDPYSEASQTGLMNEEGWFNKSYGHEVSFDFCFKGLAELIHMLHCNIKKCGVRLLYVEAKTKPSRMFEFDPDDEKEESNSKRIKYSNQVFWFVCACHRVGRLKTNGSLLMLNLSLRVYYARYERYRSQFRYPGGEIPEWFCKKDTGSSLTLMLSSNGRPLLGISFCVVISCEIPSAVRNVCCKCHLKAVKGESDDRFFTSHYWAGNEEILNSDNIFLWFNSWETESAKGDNGFNKYYQASFEFLASDHSNKLINMKKCGVHLLYSEETNESQVKTADKNFTAVSEDCWVLTREDTNNKRGRDDDCFTGSKPYESGRSNKRIRRCSA